MSPNNRQDWIVKCTGERQHFVRMRHCGQEEAGATAATPAVAETLPEADFELFRFLFVVHLSIINRFLFLVPIDWGLACRCVQAQDGAKDKELTFGATGSSLANLPIPFFW